MKNITKRWIRYAAFLALGIAVAIPLAAQALVSYPAGSLLQPSDVATTTIRDYSITPSKIASGLNFTMQGLTTTNSTSTNATTTNFAVTSGALNLNGVTIKFPNTQGNASTFPQNDGSGNITWVNPSATTISFTSVAGENISAGAPVYIKSVTTGTITKDNATSISSAQNNLSTTYTMGSCSNSILYVVASAYHLGGTTVNSMAFNGVSMTQVATLTYNTSFVVRVFRLVAPAAGTNSLTSVVSNTSEFYNYAISSYCGANQSSPEDVTRSQASSGTSVSEAITTLTNGDWVMLGGQFVSGTITEGTNIVRGSTNNGVYVGDTNTFVSPAGSLTQTLTVPTGSWGVIQIAIAPVSAPTSQDLCFNANASATGTANGYIGFAATTVTTGNAISVETTGIDANQSGLTTGTQYYLGNTAGTVSTSAGSVTRKVGISLSTTKMLIENGW